MFQLIYTDYRVVRQEQSLFILFCLITKQHASYLFWVEVCVLASTDGVFLYFPKGGRSRATAERLRGWPGSLQRYSEFELVLLEDTQDIIRVSSAVQHMILLAANISSTIIIQIQHIMIRFKGNSTQGIYTEANSMYCQLEEFISKPES